MQAQLDAMVQQFGTERFTEFIRLADKANRLMETSNLNIDTEDDRRGETF